MSADMGNAIKSLTQRFYVVWGRREALLDEQTEKETLLSNEEEELVVIQDAKRLLELFVRSTETSIKSFLEPIVTEGLEFVFEQYLKFHVVFFQRRNQVEADFVILRNEEQENLFQELMATGDVTKELEDIVRESKNINFMYGGAINQVLGLILRIVLFHTLRVRGPLVLDEPSSAVSPAYNSRLGQLISSLSKRLSIQIILITHSSELASFAEKTYLVSKTVGESVVEQEVSSS